ncbi:DUF924 family protein [Caballeronia sordidicola]|jgi:uncharacterized protein (DUF924 family)|uniref:Putative transmembrane protein n=1 Tax=Caballeronia sordidicola TaxID=196367 RepID=A0A226WQ52_CABSO|nr:DUF924 family protein [Caballeronia sordidicola]OXC73314.1 putative transmembrane protein [Caballeronia sordidicola]
MLDARAQAVLDVWFGAPDSAEFGHPRKAWFKKDASFDAMLHERFGALIEEALEGRLASWSATPLGALALIVLLDQFTRNCFRSTSRAFAGDAEALKRARSLVDSRDELALPTIHHRVFAYMPFEHDETLASQREAVRLLQALFDETGDEDVEDFLQYARRHAEVIERFGRFPHRNVTLGRETTAAEHAWLKKKGGF